MKKDYVLKVLFFAALWGSSEALLGGVLYGGDFSLYTSVPLTVIAFIVLTIAKMYLPQNYSATLIASIAMLYKFLNQPFFGCHLLAIFFLGFSYDLFFGIIKIKIKALSAVLATYLGYSLFAFAITYVFRYHYWLDEGFSKIIRYVGYAGTLAAFGNFLIVPLVVNLGRMLREKTVRFAGVKSRFAIASLSLATFILWFLGLAQWL